MPSPKTFIFGIDGGTLDIIEPMVASGELPNLGALLRNGCSARTSATWSPYTGPGWASFLTGWNPGRHRIFQFLHPQQAEYRARIMGPEEFGCP